MAERAEWLVTDQRGAFAMGTPLGTRTRKYHGFFMGIPGRSETAYLVDLEIYCNGLSVWPHQYASPHGPVIHPDLIETGIAMNSQITQKGPKWDWDLPQGELCFQVKAHYPGGIRLSWKWSSKKKYPCFLKVRGFWAMRDLHGIGGRTWTWRAAEDFPTQGLISSGDGKVAHCLLQGNWSWKDDPQWYENFHYSEEITRGYEGDEDLYSAGLYEINLEPNESCEWIIAEDANDLVSTQSEDKAERSTDFRKAPSRVSDFILTRPAGMVAGFPWFGEWGRDTFISLPGVVAALLKSGKDQDRLWLWVQELLHRWGSWIEQNGMLPNVLERDGRCQWESADATLWWCHSLASLWMLSLCPPFPFSSIELEFKELLNRAIESIRNGRHLFLKETSIGLLEVTSPHVTWMDAKVHGNPVTPRLGCLPEINSLWFEACCLQSLWSEPGDSDFEGGLEKMGSQVLQCYEPDRPNRIFLHSLPLAPSFVLGDSQVLERDLFQIAENFWTPFGLRSLRPTHPAFKPRCAGSQEERDLCYHQGAVWGWLGGQFEIVKDRFELTKENEYREKEKMFSKEILSEMPIEGHIPEIFDADPPYHSRGAPAQAWSLACLEEAKARRRLKVDAKISKVLSRRWLGRSERKEKLSYRKNEREVTP